MTGATSGAGTAYPSGEPEVILVFSGLLLDLLFSVFYRSLFVLLSFFFWQLCCLSFFDFRILITSLVPSNSSCEIETGIIASIAHFCVICVTLTFDTFIVYNVCILRVYDTLMLVIL
jgi:hypothetical protein